MKNKNRVAFLNFFSNLLLKGISIFSAPVFSRLLGTSGYGVVSVYNIWTNILGVILPMQSSQTIVNAKVEFPEEDQDKYQSSILTMSLMGFLGAFVICLLFGKHISGLINLPVSLLFFMILQAFGNFATSFAGSKYTYEFKAGRNFFMSTGVTVASLGISLLLVLSLPQESRYLGRIWGNVIVYAGLGTILTVGVLRRGRTFFRRDYWKFCITLALPMVFYSISDMILAQSDQIMLQTMMDSTNVGLYGLAYTFSNVLFTIFHSLNNTWMPFFFDDMKKGEKESVHTSALNFLELFTILSMGFVLLAPEVFKLYGGRDFWDGIKLIPLFSAGYYLNFLCTFPVNFDYYHKKNKMVALITVSCAVVNLGLNYVLIGCFGAFGAALATTMSHLLQLILHHIYAAHILGKGEYPYPAKMWLSYGIFFAVAFGMAYLFPNAWLLRWGFGAVLGLWELHRIYQRRSLL